MFWFCYLTLCLRYKILVGVAIRDRRWCLVGEAIPMIVADFIVGVTIYHMIDAVCCCFVLAIGRLSSQSCGLGAAFEILTKLRFPHLLLSFLQVVVASTSCSSCTFLVLAICCICCSYCISWCCMRLIDSLSCRGWKHSACFTDVHGALYWNVAHVIGIWGSLLLSCCWWVCVVLDAMLLLPVDVVVVSFL